MQHQTIGRWLLILGTTFVFVYFGIDKFVHPQTWIYWMPDWMENLGGLSLKTWMDITAVAEIIIGVMLLTSMRRVQKLGALLASLHLIAILTQVGWNDVAVRDIGLLAMTASLWFLL